MGYWKKALDKRNNLRERGHMLVYQNNHELSDDEKQTIMKIRKDMQSAQEFKNKLDSRYQKYLDIKKDKAKEV